MDNNWICESGGEGPGQVEGELQTAEHERLLKTRQLGEMQRKTPCEGRKDADIQVSRRGRTEEETQGVERNQVRVWYSTRQVKKMLFQSAVVQANATEMMSEMRQNWPLDLSVETNLNFKYSFRKLFYLVSSWQNSQISVFIKLCFNFEQECLRI